jgi:HK97 family phage major capsid protein
MRTNGSAPRRGASMVGISRLPEVRGESDTLDAGANFCRIVHAIGGASLSPGMSPAQFAKEVLDDHIMAAALSASGLSSGGGLIREGLTQDFIEALRPATLVRRRVPEFNIFEMPSGNLPINKLTGGTVGQWIGEAQKPSTTPPTFGQVRLAAKKWVAEFPVSNSLLRWGGPNAQRIIRAEVIAAAAQAEDLAFLRGPGTEYTPRGLTKWAGKVIAAQSSPNIAKVTKDTGDAMTALAEAGSDFSMVSWVASAKTWVFLGNQRTTDGAKAWPELDRGLFRGLPLDVTSQIPANLGTGENESELLLVDWLEVAIGDALSFKVELSQAASYYDGATMVSAFDRDETVLRIIHETDIVARRAARIALIEQANWIP